MADSNAENSVIGPPYVGDMPGMTYPGVTKPVLSILSEEPPTMEWVYLIWAVTADFPEAPWVVAAFDAKAREEDDSSFVEALEDAESRYGARFVRVTRTKVNMDAVLSAFDPVEV